MGQSAWECCYYGICVNSWFRNTVIADNHRVRSFHGRKEEQSRQQRVKNSEANQ